MAESREGERLVIRLFNSTFSLMTPNPPHCQSLEFDKTSLLSLSFTQVASNCNSNKNKIAMHYSPGGMYSIFRGWFSLDRGVHRIHDIPFQMKAINLPCLI